MASNALIKLTEERIDSNEKLQTFVEKAKAVTIPLFPETVQFTDTALKYGAAIVTVDTQLDNYGNNRDIYRNESGGYCLHLSKLNEIAQQSGIVITDSRILERKTDERGRVVFISHQVKGRLKSVDGSIKEDVATGKYDYYRDCEKYVKKDGKQITGMINSRRSHAEALAESNAKTRLFTKLVAKLPTNFSLDELNKPFLIPYVLEDKDEILKQLPEDEQNRIRRDLARKRLGLTDTIYGGPEADQNKGELSPKKVETEEANYTVENDELPAALTNEPTPEEQAKIEAETFREVPQAARTSKILDLVKETGYTDPNNAAITKNRIEKQSVENQVKFIEKLLNLMNEEAPL